MLLLATYMSEAAPNLKEEDSARLVRFIAVQDLSWAAKRPGAAIPRAKAVIEFLEEAEPPFAALVSLCHTAKRHADDPEQEPHAKSAASRALIMAMGCLNTVQACREEGGARALFGHLREKPKGALMRRLEKYEFAKAAIQQNPTPPTPAADDDLSEIDDALGIDRSKPLSEAAKTQAMKAAEDLTREPTEQEEFEAAISAMNIPKVKKPSDFEKKESRWTTLGKNLAKVVLLHLAFVTAGLAIRGVYKEVLAPVLLSVPSSDEL